MKKFLALLLSLALALSACAFAEEAEPITHSHKLSNVYIILGDQVIDMSDLSIELDISGEDEANAWCLHMNSKNGTVSKLNMSMEEGGIIDVDASGMDEKVQLSSENGTIAEIGLAKVDGDYVIHLASEGLGHVDYAIDPVALIAKIMDKGVNGIAQILQSLNTTDLAQSLVNAFSKVGAQPEAAEELAEPEETEAPAEAEAAAQLALKLPQISIEGDLTATLMACLSEPETTQMGGVQYAPDGSEIIIADGTYTTQEFTIDTETLCTILNMIYLDGEPSGWGDKVRETGIGFEVKGSFQKGEEEGLNQIATVTASMNDGETEQTMTLDLNTFYAEDGKTTAVSCGLAKGEQALGVSFNVTTGQHEGDAFTPDSIDMENAIMLTDMDLDEAFTTLGASVSQVNMEAMGALIAPLIQMVQANVDVDALQAQLAEAGAAEAE